MTAEQLEELLGKVTQGEWSVSHVHDENGWYGSAVCIGEKEIVWFEDDHEPDQSVATLIALAPSLARRVIAAEKLVEALDELPLGDGPLAQLVTAYREASK